MKKTNTIISVTSDYRLEMRRKRLPSSTALSEINSDRQIDYCSAILHEDQSVTLISASVTCPYCNYVHPIRRPHQISKADIERIENWADPQLNFFTPRESEMELSFFSPEVHHFTCPNCGMESNDKHNESTIFVKREKHKLFVRCEIKNLCNLFDLPYVPRTSFSIMLPLYEQIEFNIRNGHTCVRIMTDHDRVLHTVDITNNPRILTECALAEWFYKYEVVRQMVAEGFQSLSNADIPVDLCDINIDAYVFFTRFVGYNKAFYASIPYDKETLVLDSSFTNLDKLHTQKSAVTYLSSFPFAKYKSSRKLVCEQAGLLFYLPECNALYYAVEDINVFRSILESRYAFDLLILLHRHPLSLEFFSDYRRVKGAAGLFRKITSSRYSWRDFRGYALNYCSLSQHEKAAERKKWKADFSFMSNWFSANYSLPIALKLPNNIKGVVNGFTFKPIDNTSECLKVGKELKNCLKGWESCDSAVVAVMMKNEIVAAIEICDDSIVQAHTYDNGRIDEIENLPEAIEEWARRGKMKCSIKDLTEGW